MTDLPDPDVPDLVAHLDQALRQLTDVARIVRTYHDALVVAGFGPGEALALTLGYQQGLFTPR